MFWETEVGSDLKIGNMSIIVPEGVIELLTGMEKFLERAFPPKSSDAGL